MVSPLMKQSWSVSAVMLNMISQGMVLSYPSSLLPALRAPDSPIKLDLQTGTMLASTIAIAGLSGFFLSSWLMARYGRKIAHAVTILPVTIGWILIYFANNFPVLLIGRLLGGMTGGATVILGAVVIGEYTDPEYRGMFLNLKTASVSFGSMLVHIFGNFYSWRTIALLSLIPSVIATIIIFTWPESPAWLASQKQFEKSEKAFFWLRGKNEYSIREFEDMIKAQKTLPSESRGIMGALKKFKKKNFLKPMMLILFGGLLLEVSGRHFFPAYALDIIGEIIGSQSQSFYYILIIDVIITGSATFSSVLVRLMERRTVLFGTGFAALTVLILACLYLFLVSLEVITKDYPWIPITLFLIYFILVNLGCTPIPLAFLGELMPLEHRGVGGVFAGIFFSLFVYVGLQIPPFLLASIKVYGTFAILGLSMFIILMILYFYLPETKDKTLQEIEEYFNTGKFNDRGKFRDEEDVRMEMLEKK